MNTTSAPCSKNSGRCQYEVCHSCYWRLMRPYLLFCFQFIFWLLTICAFRRCSCEVMSCNYYLCFFCFLVHLYFWYVTHWVYLLSSWMTVQVAFFFLSLFSHTHPDRVVLCFIAWSWYFCISPADSQSKFYWPDDSSCCCLYSVLTQTQWLASFNVVSVAKRVNVKFNISFV